MTAGPVVDCERHGPQPVRFVCIHVAQATDSGVPVGFHEEAQQGELPPIAWCDACEAWLCRPGVEWDDAFQAQAGFVMFCAGCFAEARSVCGGGGLPVPRKSGSA